MYKFLARGISHIFLQIRDQVSMDNIEIDNDERGVIGDFTMISDIRITKAKPE